MATNEEQSEAKQSSKKCTPKAHNKYDISEQYRSDIINAFNLVDTNGEGFIESKQLKFAMRALGFEPKKEEINKLVAEIDNTGSGLISCDDFASIMSRRISEKDTNEEIMKAFQLFDDDNTGKISFANLRNVAKELGENLSDDELREMIAEADLDGDQQINCDEFLRIMKKTCLY